jgi:DNA primase
VEPPPPLFPEEDLINFSEPLTKKALSYLKGRGVTDESMALWEMRFHRYQSRVILPLRDVDKRLVGLSGRAIYPKPSIKMLHLDGFPRGQCLYGEHLVVPGHTGILVEGQFDVIALWQYGYRYPVAVFGTGLAPGQIAKIVKLFSDVIILTDSDDRGVEAAEKWEAKLKGHLPVKRVNMLEGKDPGDVMEEGCLEDLVEILGSPQVC